MTHFLQFCDNRWIMANVLRRYGFLYTSIKGIVHQIWINNIFSVSQQNRHLYKVHQLWLGMIEKNGAQSQSVLYIYSIYNSTWSVWLWAPYFLNYFESELFYRDPFMKNVSFVKTRKNDIYSKLVNNLFKLLLLVS